MISTHILDTSVGLPAKNVKVILERIDLNNDKSWILIEEKKTNNDGRIVFNCPFEEGSYRLTFFICDYYKQQNKEVFFLDTPVAFNVKDSSRKYHVPLLLNPYGYSTYRGS